MSRLEKQILEAWQGLKDLSDFQMECEHNFWETPGHAGDRCIICGIEDGDTTEKDDFYYFHDGYQMGYNSAISKKSKK
jgi:hypothetical protein